MGSITWTIFLFLASAVWADEFIDGPVQLIGPDETHTQLVVHEENVRLLNHIHDEVAGIAVVGTFHSGKSFLLNQLRNQSDGFEIGSTVHPTTMGIWMWGTPIPVTTASGATVQVLLLDTEGFAASDVAEVYDAKIFAVSCLLSSFLVFNDVKIINQNSVDYLEILARRAQLFGVKAQLITPLDESTSGESESLSENPLIAFPPLLWIVQDFWQDLDGKTPTEWLMSLLNTPRKDAPNCDVDGGADECVIDSPLSETASRSHLMTIFPSIECRTLFIPATSMAALRNLASAEQDELTAEYRSELEAVKGMVMSRVEPKEFNGRVVTGPVFAQLLRVLVDAANDNQLTAMPSLWSMFLTEQRHVIVRDCGLFYDRAMSSVTSVLPVPQSELLAAHVRTVERSQVLVETLLTGLRVMATEVTSDVNENLANAHVVLTEKNVNLMREMLKQTLKSIKKAHSQALAGLELPVPSTQLVDDIFAFQKKSIEAFDEQVGRFKEDEAYKVERGNLCCDELSALDLLGVKTIAENKAAITAALEQARGDVDEHARANLQLHNALPTKEMAVKISEACAAALAEYSELVGKFEREQIFAIAYDSLTVKLAKVDSDKTAENVALILVEAEEARRASAAMATRAANKLQLPKAEQPLELQLAKICGEALAKFDGTMEIFMDVQGVIAERQQLSTSLDNTVVATRKRNHREVRKFLQEPFDHVSTIVRLLSDTNTFTAEYQLRNAARELVIDELKRKKKGGQSLFDTGDFTDELFLYKVIEDYIDDELKDCIDKINSYGVVAKVIRTILRFILQLFGMW